MSTNKTNIQLSPLEKQKNLFWPPKHEIEVREGERDISGGLT